MRYSHLNLSLELQRLRRLAIYKRWIGVVACWSILAPWSIWKLRAEIELWRDYFTWTAVRYGLAYHPLAALCLLFCCGITLSTLVLHCEYRWKAISPREKTRLEQRLGAIAQLSPRHPLRRWIFQDRH